jgi:hypothetical protein
MSKPYEMMDSLLRNTTASSAIVGARIWHALRPKGPTTPNLTFFELGIPRGFTGMEQQDYQISCRDKTVAGALDLARVVVEIFNGSASTGINGFVNSFSIGRAFQSDSTPPVLPEPHGSAYNAPVAITVIYPSSTVS